MIEILEWLFIEFPLFFLVLLTLVLAFLSSKFRANTGEESLFHLTIIFLFCGLLFTSIALGVLVSDNLNIQYTLFALANFSFWFIIMELGIFYLTTFLNPNKVLPSARLYFPAIQGATVVISSLKVLEIFETNPTYSLTVWELMIYVVAFVLTLLLQSILIKELHKSRILLSDENHILFINSVKKIIISGTFCLVYVFCSMVIWAFLKTHNFQTPFSILISEFEIIDWLVYLNIPILIIAWIIFLWNIQKMNKIISKVNIQDIYNTIGT
ncbi:MAG: hypothetical protein ACW967_09240 [Candidatus Hodarchaeales archaeon]|jgi:hypothetical protein